MNKLTNQSIYVPWKLNTKWYMFILHLLINLPMSSGNNACPCNTSSLDGVVTHKPILVGVQIEMIYK